MPPLKTLSVFFPAYNEEDNIVATVSKAIAVLKSLKLANWEVIVVDEIGTEQEAHAARTIAERGVMLIATAHGNLLENLIKNPTLSDLVGGVQSVILGDEEAKRRHTQKAILERKAPPTFDVCIEIRERDKFAIYFDVAKAVDAILRGRLPQLDALRIDGTHGALVDLDAIAGNGGDDAA